MRMFAAALFLVIGLALPVVALAAGQVVHLKDGTILRGEVVAQKDGVMTFRTSIGIVSVPEASIARVEYADAPPAVTPTPAPTPTSTPLDVWGASPAKSPAATAPAGAASGASSVVADRPVYLHAKLGYHQYRGSGWSDFGRYKHDFDGPAGEIGGTARVSQQESVGIDVAFGAGYYDGSTCLRDEFGDCVTITFTNLYLLAGPRLVVDVAPAVLYGEFAIGAYSSSFKVTYKAAGEPAVSDSDSRLTPAAHFLIGGGLNASPKVRLFLEGKFVYADGKFPDATEKLDMGGLLFLTGIAVRFN